MSDHRCVAGSPTIDVDCTWHHEHHWCPSCVGFYGVPHYQGCHTARVIRDGFARRTGSHCACRYCEVERKYGYNFAIQLFGPQLDDTVK